MCTIDGAGRIDASTGDVLWSVPMPPEGDGDYPIAIGMPRFSDDGSFVDLTAASFEQSWVYAFEMPRTVGVADQLAGDLAGLDLRAWPRPSSRWSASAARARRARSSSLAIWPPDHRIRSRGICDEPNPLNSDGLRARREREYPKF